MKPEKKSQDQQSRKRPLRSPSPKSATHLPVAFGLYELTPVHFESTSSQRSALGACLCKHVAVLPKRRWELLSFSPCRNCEPGKRSERRKACCSSEMAIQPNCIPVLCQLYGRFISFHWSNGQQLNLISKTTLTQSHTVLNVMKSFSSLSLSPLFFPLK